MEDHIKELVDSLGALQRSKNIEKSVIYVSQRFVNTACKIKHRNEPARDYYCTESAEAFSFLIVLVQDSPLPANEKDIIFASLALFEEYRQDESLTARRKHYLIDFEKNNPPKDGAVPFKDLCQDAQKNKADALNKKTSYRTIATFFCSLPNPLEYILEAYKKCIKEKDGEKQLVLPTPSYNHTEEPESLNDEPVNEPELPEDESTNEPELLDEYYDKYEGPYNIEFAADEDYLFFIFRFLKRFICRARHFMPLTAMIFVILLMCYILYLTM